LFIVFVFCVRHLLFVEEIYKYTDVLDAKIACDIMAKNTYSKTFELN